MKLTFFITLIALFCCSANAQNNNGQLDNIEELATKFTIPVTMPDGINLMTDVYLPILRDSLLVTVNIPLVGNQTIQLLPKGIQYIMKYLIMKSLII